MKLSKGKIVTIYDNPITKKKSEGKAKLIEKVTDTKFKGDQEYWQVKFLLDGFVTNRFI